MSSQNAKFGTIFGIYLELYNLALMATFFGLVMFAVLPSTKLKQYKGCMFSNVVKIMIFILNIQYYVPIKLCKTVRSIHLYKIRGTIKLDNVKCN